jgi:hypothetical protein
MVGHIASSRAGQQLLSGDGLEFARSVLQTTRRRRPYRGGLRRR